MEFNLIDFLFLGPLVIIGIISSYTDIKYNKIFNKLIIAILLYILFFYLFLLFVLQVNYTYLLNLISNGAIAFSVGYLLWYFKLWSAGDAKLFTVYSFLIPLSFYSKSYIHYFPSFNLLINLFVPLLVIIIISALITLIKEISKIKKKSELMKLIEIKKAPILFLKLSQLYLNYVFIFIILQSFIFPLAKSFQFKDVFSNPFFIFGLLMLTIGSFNKLRQKKIFLNWIIYLFIFSYFLFLIFIEKDFIKIINTLRVSLVFMIFIGLTRIILNLYIQKKEIRKIKIKNIKEGMIPVDNEICLFLNKNNSNFGRIDAGGLSEDQIKIISDFFKNDQDSEIKIYKTIPFAPFLFLSAIISIITQSSFLPFIDNLFQKLV